MFRYFDWWIDRAEEPVSSYFLLSSKIFSLVILSFLNHTQMKNVWSISRTPLPIHIPPPPLITSSSSSKPQNLRFLNKIKSLPARDRVIDFGKYKGKMLGTLPSTYLKWVSNNLRAREFEEWAQLADQVLEDPIYKDRIEWEFAQNVLNGDVLRSSRSGGQVAAESPVDELAEISDRFGWDNEDKVGWAKVDFGLLGTSGGGRLPRLTASEPKISSSIGPRPNRDEPKRTTTRDVGEKRRERMERVKLRRNKEGNFGNSVEIALDTKGGGGGKEGKKVSNISRSSFPGREVLLEKLLKRNKGGSGCESLF